MNNLKEYRLDQLYISAITDKAINKNGLGRVSLVSVKFNYPNNILLEFDVESSTGNATHFSNNGQALHGNNNGYEVVINFINIANIVPSNFNSLQYSQQQQILATVFDTADVEVSCDCGGWYWQGMEQDDDKTGVSYYAFTGRPGKDIWKSRHAAAGGDHGKGICKHIYAAAQELDNLIPEVLKKLNISSSGTAQSTIQQQTLKAPAQPAGLPVEAKSEVKTGSIKSLKAEPTVEEDIDEVQSTAEQLDLPKMDTTDVKTKELNAETEAQEGPEDAEPPIEELTKSTENKTGNNSMDLTKLEDEELEEIQESKLNESQLREKYVPIAWDSREKNVVDCNTEEPISNSIMKSLRFTTGKRSWKWAKPNENNETLKNAENYIITIAREADEHEADSFLIMHKDGVTPAGGVAFYKEPLGPFMDDIFEKLGLDANRFDFPCDGKETIVSEIALIGFIQNDITLVRDVLVLMDKMLDRYPIIEWTVHNENPVKRAYDKIIQRYKGVSRSDDNFTHYAIVCKEWRDKQKLNEVYTRKDRAFIITPSGEVFGGPYHETILKHDFPEMWEEMYNYCIEKDFSTEDLSISGMIQRKMYRRDYIKIMCKTSGPLEVWIVLERMRKRSYNDIVKWANAYLNDVYDGTVHIMLDDNRQQYDCTLKELADDMMIERLLESKAEDEFQQIYDDLTDAHGYLADESNKWKYRNLARDVKDIRDDFEFIYNQTHMKESKLDYWQERLEQLDVGTDEWFKAKSERDEILNHESNPTQLDYWGTCIEVSSHKSGDPWGGDVTNMANDLGYYATFNDNEDESNYEEISEGKFFEVAQEKALPDHEFIFLKRYDDTVYIAYDIDSDIHYIWW